MIHTCSPNCCQGRWRYGSLTFRGLVRLLLVLAVWLSTSLPDTAPGPEAAERSGRRADRFFIVDCLLPGQVRRLGRGRIHMTPSRPVKTSAQDCRRRGGAYAPPDRSNYATALKVWLPRAKQGDKVAQTNVGEIYEKGLGQPPDYRRAAAWYRKAAEQGYGPAQVNLGHLYEQGLGVERDAATAQQWNRRASGLKAAEVRQRRDTITRSQDGKVTPARPSTVSETIAFGRYHALVIGNETYTYWDVLETPENDARTVAKLLEEKYGFKVELLLDATRNDLLKAFNIYRAKLSEKDNLLVYYAGHGHLDEKNRRGYWVPIDGELSSDIAWIPAFRVTDILSAADAKHVLVVADSCYSGILTRSSVARLEAGASAAARQHFLKVVAQKRARLVLTSGGVEPTLDIGGRGHSVFAGAFLNVLRENEGILLGLDLYSQVRDRVTFAADALAVEQIPRYQPIRFAGHAWGDFVFVPMAK